MFVNLVRIGLLRLFKGSRFIIGAVLALGMIFTVFLFRELLLVEEVITDADMMEVFNAPMVEQYSGFTIGVEAGLLFCMYSTVCFVCDYYKNRQKINIEGMIRSRSKICLSEICALFIFSMTLGLFGPAVSFLGLIESGFERILIVEYPLTFLYTTLAGGMMIFLMSLPVFFCCKLFRKKVLSIVAYGVIYAVSMFIIGFSASFDIGVRKALESGAVVELEVEAAPAISSLEIVGCFLFPGTHLFSAATGTPTDVPFSLIVVSVLVNIIVWSALSVLASRRDSEI